LKLFPVCEFFGWFLTLTWSSMWNIIGKWSESRISGTVTSVCVSSRSYVTTDGQTACLGVKPTLGLMTRYYFPSDGCCLKVEVLFLWSVLSDKRTSWVVVVTDGQSAYLGTPSGPWPDFSYFLSFAWQLLCSLSWGTLSQFKTVKYS
jgi:hypothetical protein